jgi:hypothetical protein
VADETRRWFADSNVSYALAAIALLEYAREHRVKYVFGPLDTKAMTDGGLVVSGSSEDLVLAAKVLSDIPGLAEYLPDGSPA